MIKAYKFKIKRPPKAVVAKFEQWLDVCRELYNAALQERRDAWRLNKKSVTCFEQINQLPEIKKVRDDLKEVHSQVLTDVLRRLDKTFEAFFTRVKKGGKAGFPRFKGANRYDSFCYPQSGFSLNGDKLTLSKIGTVKLRLSQNVIGKIKTCTIKRECGNWFVVFSIETLAEVLPKTGIQIGIDAGIESFITLSNGEQIENFKYFESSQKQLRRAQRKVQRRKKGSQRRKQAVLQLKKIHAKIKNQRLDFHHKISHRLVKEFDLIAIEKLNIKGLSKGIFAKQVHDTAWGNFFSILKCKAENAGKSVVEVNPSGTSQTCICGERVEKTLSIRLHSCIQCGYSNHRDIVSAQVILQRAGHTLLAQTKAVRL